MCEDIDIPPCETHETCQSGRYLNSTSRANTAECGPPKCGIVCPSGTICDVNPQDVECKSANCCEKWMCIAEETPVCPEPTCRGARANTGK